MSFDVSPAFGASPWAALTWNRPQTPTKGPSTSTEAHVALAEPAHRGTEAGARRFLTYAAGVLALAAAYYAAAKIGQTLRYTASVAAIWPPAGLGIAALYLWGLRWWPGILIGELVVNAELLGSLPFGSLLGQQAGNMAEIVAGAYLLRRLIGPRASLDRLDQIGGMLLAIGIATAISATVGTVSMLAGGVIEGSESLEFWRTWWLGDTAGALVVLPMILAWADPGAAWRRIRTMEGAFLIAAVGALSVLAFSVNGPVTYLVFPALIWAAFRFGPAGATLSVAITAVVAIGITAHDVGPWSKQMIDHRTLSTQLYIAVAALTTLFLSALADERERSSTELLEAKRKEGERALEERHRIARDLHDSVSQALFSTALHTRTAQKALETEGLNPSGRLGLSLSTIGELIRGAQAEMRALIFELRRDAVSAGLVAALVEHASSLAARDGLTIVVDAPERRLGISTRTAEELFAIGREALSNVLKHADASSAFVRVESRPGSVFLEIVDNGRGFDSAADHPGHFGLESMRSRASELDGRLTITSTPGNGTVVRVEVPAETPGVSDVG
jgi:signal transduction histidine kinase